METEHLNHDCSTLPNLAINADITNELLIESEIRSNTKAILDNVCNDFESIDVLSSKENKLLLLKKWQPPAGSFSEYSNDGSDITCVSLDRNAECTPTESIFVSNAESSLTDSIQDTSIDESTLNSQITTAIVVPSVDPQNQTSSDVVNSVKNIRTEMVPLQDSSKVGILSDNFANDKNLSSSLAELADAEIVQTSENAVSIIISNPRFIQVLNCKDPSLPSDTSDITLDSNCIVSEKENLNEYIVEGSAPVSHYSLHTNGNNLEKDPHSEVANVEIIYSEGTPHSSTPNTLNSKREEKRVPYYRSRADLGKVAATRARRITAKMKADWARVLEEKGVLVCPLSGCLQKYKTMANFQTHFKYCYSGMEKNLKHCPYCASVIFSSYKAVVHHMQVEHPEKLEEYKTNFPQPENVYDCFEDDSSRLVEISQKSFKNHKRKFNVAKENRLFSRPKKRILKTKMKTNQSGIENSQLRECGRFDEIVSKISSVNKTHPPSAFERDENRLNKERRKRKLILTGHVVSAEKYFEDERDVDDAFTLPIEKEIEEKEKVNTKSRLVLNMDRYKRYTQYLTVTRDFGSHRRTYSRPKSSNVFDSSQLSTAENDFSESDIHQLNSSLESSSISLNENDTLCLPNNDLCCDPPEISAFDPLHTQSEASILNKIHLDSKTKRNSLLNCETNIETVIGDSLKSNFFGPSESFKEKIPCYKAQISVTPSPKIESVPSRKPPMKISPIITYGKIPDSISALKPDRSPAVDFDSLVKNSATNKKINSQTIGNITMQQCNQKYNKEDGIKHPKNDSFITPVKRKRGRPRKDSLVVGDEKFTVFKNVDKTKMISEDLHTPKDLKALCVYKKSGNLNRVNKTHTYTLKSLKKGRKIAKNSKGTMNKISSKVRSKILEERSAKSSLKKAIMCGKRNRRGRPIVRAHMFLKQKKKRGRPPGVCIKSLLKNAKPLPQKKKNRECTGANLTPIKNSDHNYFSSIKIAESEENSEKSNELSDKTGDNIVLKEHPSCNISLPSNQVELEKGKEVIYTTNSSLTHSEKFEKELILPVSIPLQSVENAFTAQNKENTEIATTTPKTLEQPTISSEMETNLSISSHPPVLIVSPSVDKMISEAEDSTPVVFKRSRGRPRKSTTPQQAKKDEPPLKCSKKSLVCVNENSSPSPPSGLRKSERVRKRKFGSPEKDGEIKTPELRETEKVVVSSEKFEKTGRRGRPRKFPRVEKDEDLTEKQPERNPSLSVRLEDTPCNTFTRGRRGRPRIEKSEPEVLQTRNICKEADKHVDQPTDQNVENQKESKNDKDVHPQSVSGKTDSRSPSEKQLILLPLKKRKKVEEKIRVERESMRDIIVLEKEAILRTDKKVVSDKRNKDVPVWGAEKKFPDSLQTSRIDLSKKLIVPCSKVGGKMDRSEIYPTLKPKVSEYKVSPNKHTEYLQASITIKINKCEWTKLKCFDSVSLDDSKSSAFFTGGPVQSSAFCNNIPTHMDQYIALASSDFLYNGQKSFSYVDEVAKNEKGIIQFWNLGCLQSTRLNQLPRMELALEHEHGIILQMKWAPKGGFNLPDDIECSRLGLLALSCSDSYIRVYSVPHPNILPKTASNTAIYNTNPSLVLTPIFGGPSSLTRRSIATCLAWHQNAEIIAAGYGNGCICVWMVKVICASSATIVTVKNEDKKNLCQILPYLVFEASGAPVTSISFAPLNSPQYLVSSSFDKTLKFFDLRDTSMPFCSIKRGFALDDCKWGKGFCGASVSLHDGIIFKGSTFAKECGVEEYPASNIAGTVGSLTCSATSDIADVQAMADITGSVIVNFFHGSCDQIKQPSFDTYVIFETEVVTLGQHAHDSSDKAENAPNSEVSSVLNDAMDILEVMDDFSKQVCEYNSNNVPEVVGPSSDKVEESTRLNEPELIELMNYLLESVILISSEEREGIERERDKEDSIVLNSEGRKVDETIIKKAITSPFIASTCDVAKGERHFPIEEMLNDIVPIHKKQSEDVVSNKKLNISDELHKSCWSPSDAICIDNFATEDVPDTAPSSFPKDSSLKHFVESDCSIVLQNCVESLSVCVCDTVLHGSESKSDCSTVPEQPAGSECNVVPLQTVESECNLLKDPVKSGCSVAPESIESECSVLTERSVESECSVLTEPSVESECVVLTERSVESECVVLTERSVELQHSAESEGITLRQSLEAVSNVHLCRAHDLESEQCSESECNVQQSMKLEHVPQQTVVSECVAVQQPTKSEHKGAIQEVVESECSVVPQLKSDAESSDVSIHGEESDDSLSVISECSYASSDSCDSIPSFLTESLTPDTPSESPTPVDKEFLPPDMPFERLSPIPTNDKEENLSPDTHSPFERPIPIDDEEFSSTVPSSSIDNEVALSELSSLLPEKNCSTQQAAEESASKIDSNELLNTQELGCNEMLIFTLNKENELENEVREKVCLRNGEKNDLYINTHVCPHASDPPQTFDSSSKPECSLEGEQKNDSVVPNCLLTSVCETDIETILHPAESSPTNLDSGKESDHMEIETIQENSPSNSNDSLPMLELNAVEEPASLDLVCKPECISETSRKFLKNVSSDKTTEAYIYNSEERTTHTHKESPVSYASLISSCGLIFKDVNSISTSSDEKKDSLPVESNVLSSVNTISWNPNYGSHFWLVTAGNSGVARLICVSELSPQENTSLLDKESIM